MVLYLKFDNFLLFLSLEIKINTNKCVKTPITLFFMPKETNFIDTNPNNEKYRAIESERN